MKTPLALTIAGLLGGMTGFTFGADPHGDPYVPIGSLDVSESQVRTGSKTALSWDIEYPKTTDDLVDIDPTGTLTTKTRVRVQVRVVGVAFQSGSTQLPVASWIRTSGSNWERIFYGRSYDVEPDVVRYEATVEAGTQLDFAGRARSSNGSWLGTRTTTQPDVALIALRNGDSVPSYAPAYSQGNIEDFLTSFVNEDLTVNLGPRDLIYLYELASRNPDDWWFDMQDLVVVVTFDEVED